MPRPKRGKIAPSAPATIYLSSKQAITSNLQSHLSSPKSRTTTNSDDSTGIVKRNENGTNNRGVAKQDVEMSGALLISSDSSSTRPRSMIRKGSAQNLGQPALNTTKTSLSQQHKEFLSKSQELSSRPAQKYPRIQRKNSREDIFASTVKITQPSAGMNWKSQATPQADSSILSLANFKRRPRQPSLLGIGRPDDSPSISSLGDLETEYRLLEHGNVQKAPGLDFTIMDDLSDFEPQNESTPFTIAKGPPVRQIRSVSVSSNSSSGRSKSHVDNIEDVPESPGSAFESQLGKVPQALPSILGSNVNKKKRKSIGNVQVLQSQQSPHARVELHDRVKGTISNEILDEPELPATKRQAVASDTINDVMALPKSSSPLYQSPPYMEFVPECVPTRGRGRPKRNRPGNEGRQGFSTSTRQNGPKALSTAKLQSFLPRRRNARQHQQFRIHSDSPEPSGEEEDELSYMDSAKRPNGKVKRSVATASRTPKSNVRSRAINTIITSATASKEKVHVDGLGSSRLTRTYSRRFSDKENEPSSILSGEGGEDNDSLMPVSEDESIAMETSMDLSDKARKELRHLAKKFKEVDEWTMEFEDVTASSSSPNDAR